MPGKYDDFVEHLGSFDIKTFMDKPSDYLLKFMHILNEVLRDEKALNLLLSSTVNKEKIVHFADKLLIANDKVLNVLKNPKIIKGINQLNESDHFSIYFTNLAAALKSVAKEKSTNGHSLGITYLRSELDIVLDEHLDKVEYFKKKHKLSLKI